MYTLSTIRVAQTTESVRMPRTSGCVTCYSFPERVLLCFVRYWRSRKPIGCYGCACRYWVEMLFCSLCL